MATLTYVYSDQTAVLGPLASHAEPHCYDLCTAHAERLTAPRGWEIVRLSGHFEVPEPTHDDLLALADAVREAAKPKPDPVSLPPENSPGRGSHLRLVEGESSRTSQ